MRLLMFICLSIFFPLSVYAATPTITSVTGTVETGQTLTISGSNMVQEDTTNWATHFKTIWPNASGFEGINPYNDGYSRIGPADGIYTNTVKLMGSQSIVFHDEGAHTENNFNYNAINFTWPSYDYWIRMYVRWDATGGWPTSHIKMLNIGGVSGSNPWYVQPSATPDDLMPSTLSTNNNISPITSSLPSQLQSGRWYLFEIHNKPTSQTQFEVYIDGVRVVNRLDDPAHTPAHISIGLINLCCTDAGWNLNHYWDGFAASSTRVNAASKIEISNSFDYATGAKVYQEPVYLSDGTVQIKADLSGLGTGPYYLFVTNNRNETSAVHNLTDGTPPVTTPDKSAGRYETSQTVTLTPSETVTTLYCVTPGCTPNIAYSTPIKVLQNVAIQTMRFASTDTATNEESVKEFVYKKQRRR